MLLIPSIRDTFRCRRIRRASQSGARTDRVELAKVMRRIEAGDLLIVTRLDRLARSTRDLLNILQQLAEKGAKFKSLHDPWCDTSTPQGELLVTVLTGFATFERHLIKARTDDGRKRAKAPWGAFRIAAQAGCPPAARRYSKARQGRDAGRRGAHLRRRSDDDRQAAGAASPFRKRGRMKGR
jgi:DNA invertase Pin-like site-specific DNA recombinase